MGVGKEKIDNEGITIQRMMAKVQLVLLILFLHLDISKSILSKFLLFVCGTRVFFIYWLKSVQRIFFFFFIYIIILLFKPDD